MVGQGSTQGWNLADWCCSDQRHDGQSIQVGHESMRVLVAIHIGRAGESYNSKETAHTKVDAVRQVGLVKTASRS